MSVLESTAEVPDQISSSHGAVGPSQQDPAAKRLQPFPKCEKDTNRNLPQRLDPCISQQRCGPLVDSRLPSDSAFQLPHTNASASRYSIPLRGPSARAREIGPVAKGGLWARGEGGGEPPAPPGWDRGDCPLPSACPHLSPAGTAATSASLSAGPTHLLRAGRRPPAPARPPPPPASATAPQRRREGEGRARSLPAPSREAPLLRERLAAIRLSRAPATRRLRRPGGRGGGGGDGLEAAQASPPVWGDRGRRAARRDRSRRAGREPAARGGGGLRSPHGGLPPAGPARPCPALPAEPGTAAAVVVGVPVPISLPRRTGSAPGAGSGGEASTVGHPPGAAVKLFRSTSPLKLRGLTRGSLGPGGLPEPPWRWCRCWRLGCRGPA